MQETEKLVLGIDLCDDITQVTVMRPRAAEPDAVCFDAENDAMAEKHRISGELYRRLKLMAEN